MTSTTWKLRPFDGSDADYTERVRVTNAYLPDSPNTVEMRRVEDGLRTPGSNAAEWLAEADGRVVGYGLIMNSVWSQTPGRRFVWPVSEPEWIGTLAHRDFIEFLVNEAQGDGITKLESIADDRILGTGALLESLGFVSEQRNPVTKLDLDTFDADRWRAREAELNSAGFRFLTVAEVAREDPNGYIPRIHELVVDLVRDVPSPDPIEMEPVEEFYRYAASPAWDPESELIALEGDHMVGRTGLKPSPADGRYGNTSLTGVRRSHRRRGLATALKAIHLARARQRGIQWVFTDNEKDNPMLQINLQLGFKEVYALHIYGRHLSA